MTLALRGVIALAVALAVLVARRLLRHRPIAIVLGVSLVLDVMRSSLGLPRDVERALYFVPAALSAWAALRVFQRDGYEARVGIAPALWFAAALASLLARGHPHAHMWIRLVALFYSVAIQGGAVVLWTAAGERWTVPQHAAAVLLVGDIAGLLGPAGIMSPVVSAIGVDIRDLWWITATQCLLVAGALAGLQTRWLLRSRTID